MVNLVAYVVLTILGKLLMQQNEMEYAGFWIRVGATLIDTLFLSLVIVPLLLYFYGWKYLDVSQASLVAGPADFLISWVLPAIVVVVFWMRKQATPGKMLLSLRILDADTGDKPTKAQFVKRYFAYIVSGLPFGIGLIWVAFDKQKQGWHDKLAGTVVVRARSKEIE